MTSQRVLRHGAGAGTSKADVRAQDAADTAAAASWPAAVAAADERSRVGTIGRRVGGLGRGEQTAAGRDRGGRERHDRMRTRWHQPPASWSLSSHSLDRRTDFFYIPFYAALLNDRHAVCDLEFCAARRALGERLPYDGNGYLTGAPAGRHVQAGDRVKGHRPAQADQSHARGEEPVDRGAITVSVGLKKCRQLIH